MATQTQRSFSGVQPSGNLTIGNYVGALQQWQKLQHESHCLFCVVDLHTLTLPQSMSPQERLDKVRQVAALYIACGIDPDKSTLFVQSHVPQHSQLAWILNCVTPLGWLSRMTQYKSKSAQTGGIGAGLLNYPVLMASDILLYDTHRVPVGEDQKQHVELACDIAGRFNHLFGDTFRIPEAIIGQVGARIMGLDDPTCKMSKSTAQTKKSHAIGLLDDEKTIRKAIFAAVTDSHSQLQWPNPSAGVANLLTIYQALTHCSKQQLQQLFAGQGYGHLKRGVFDAVMQTLQPIQARYHEVMADKATLDAILRKGQQQASRLAQSKMQQVHERLGIAATTSVQPQEK
ncbi:MAG: tryptophan--tRNA ligase [Myxococcota bacterium]